MSPRKRFIAKIEVDKSQRKITHYFPKTDKWKHDYNLERPMKKAAKIQLDPEVIAWIDLISSDDEFQASNYSTPKAKSGKTKLSAKERNRRRKRVKRVDVEIHKEAVHVVTDNFVNCVEFVETQLESDTDTVPHEIINNPLQDTSFSSDTESVHNDLNLPDTISSEISVENNNTYVAPIENSASSNQVTNSDCNVLYAAQIDQDCQIVSSSVCVLPEILPSTVQIDITEDCEEIANDDCILPDILPYDDQINNIEDSDEIVNSPCILREILTSTAQIDSTKDCDQNANNVCILPYNNQIENNACILPDVLPEILPYDAQVDNTKVCVQTLNSICILPEILPSTAQIDTTEVCGQISNNVCNLPEILPYSAQINITGIAGQISSNVCNLPEILPYSAQINTTGISGQISNNACNLPEYQNNVGLPYSAQIDNSDLCDQSASNLYNEQYAVQINKSELSSPVSNNVCKNENFMLPQLHKMPRIRTDSVCINKPKILSNSPDSSKCIRILQSDTNDLFSIDDILDDPSFQMSETTTSSQRVLLDVPVDNSNTVNETINLYIENRIERASSSNKENSPELCNTDVPMNEPKEDNAVSISEPESPPKDYNIDIDITIEPEDFNAMDTTSINDRVKDYINRKNSENIHDDLVELHHAMDRLENNEDIVTESPFYKMFFLRKIIRNVVENFDMLRLLRDVERKTLVTFLQMDTKYQYFCYKLFTRLPIWYNMYKLTEIVKLNMNPKEVADMYSYLHENNFIQTDYSTEPISTLLHQLDRTSLLRIQSNFKIKRMNNNTKETIIESLITRCNTQTTLSANFSSDQVLYKLISVEMGPCAKLENSFYTTLSRVHLLNSFTNPDLVKVSDLYFFLAQIEKGEIILPCYDVERAIGNIFPNRQDFLLYSKAAEYKHQFIIKMEKTGTSRDWKSIKAICDGAFSELQVFMQHFVLDNAFQKNSDVMNRFTACHKYTSILSEATVHLTRSNTDDVEKWLIFLLRQTYFCQKRRGLWYDRLALIHSTYKKDFDQAAQIVLEGLDDILVSESGHLELMTRGVGLIKRKTNRVRDDLLTALKLKIPNTLERNYLVRNIQGKQVPGNHGKCYYLETNNTSTTYFSVEAYSIEHYTTVLNFTDGIHCEGALFSTLFTLLFWDVIYDEYIPGTFINDLQVYPLDYFSREFYTNRENAIEGRLEQISRVWSQECFEHTIANNFNIHQKKRCGIVANLFQSGEQLVTIAKCIGRERLAVVLKRMVLHLGDMRAGLPDLFVWNSITYKCKFVEVKSEKDVLSMKQILWLNFLISANLDAEVCHVLPSISASMVPESKRATVE